MTYINRAKTTNKSPVNTPLDSVALRHCKQLHTEVTNLRVNVSGFARVIEKVLVTVKALQSCDLATDA